MDSSPIVIRGAREHNLRNIDLELPRHALIVFTGVSGSGKSSLAFDTLYAEGQRRYIESLSSYARQFLGQLPKPDADFIGGLSPAISIQQKSASRNPRSTVGTITEIADYLRVLYAQLGVGHCPECDRPIAAQTRDSIIAQILSLPAGSRFHILAPVVRGQKGEFKDLFAEMLRRGYVRARVDGQLVHMSDDLKLDKRIKHTIEIVVDRLVVPDAQQQPDRQGQFRTRVAEAIEQALLLVEDSVILAVEASPGRKPPSKSEPQEVQFEDTLLSVRYACVHCRKSYTPPTPQLFSFNSPHGMCLECDGLGTKYSFDPDLLVPEPQLSFSEGAIPLIGSFKDMGRWRRHIYEGVAKSLGIDLKTPWNKLSEQQRHYLLYGSGDRHIVWEWKQRRGVWKHGGRWEGIVPQLMTQFKKSAAFPRRRQLEKSMRVMQCPACQGKRLNAQARAVRFHNRTLIELGGMPLAQLQAWLAQAESRLTAVQRTIAGDLLREIRNRLGFLLNVGLHYLTLDRPAPSLSGGEAQRIRLASQIGSGLVGVLYVLDEPSIGLHPRDNARLLESLKNLRDLGNTVIVVEHDEETMAAADFLVDFGPGPGVRGGQIVAAGPPQQVFTHPASITGQYFTRKLTAYSPKQRRTGNGKHLKIIKANHHNLRDLTVSIPLGKFVAVTGVSGSGKSSLVNDVLKGTLQQFGKLMTHEEEDEPNGRPQQASGKLCEKIEGFELIDKLIDIDQSPIGRTPRSNPATYIKLFDEIRRLFAEMPEAKVRGYSPSRFSFNVGDGRCEACDGNGQNRLDMDFLADVWVVCSVCDGRRFNQETLQIKYRGKSIHDVLEMEVAAALEHFDHVPKIRHMLQTLHDVGLDYIKLGQPSPTLSGGEAQRIKLARELVRPSTGGTLYILDEPTTGLHFADVGKLLEVLHGLVDRGNTVLVIEHNLDVVASADWVIDLGPEGGDHGGRLVAEGTPEDIIKHPTSLTGQALRAHQNPRKRRAAGSKPSRNQSQSRQQNHFNWHQDSNGQQSSNRLRDQDSDPSTRNGEDQLHIVGAHQHNLKYVSASLPRGRMTVFCGPSGSGKSSLAMDTIYTEGQRRYVESLSSYARQFLGQVQKPKVEQITGLSPAIAIEQKTTSRSPRSTVGTITEVYDYLRILYARLAKRWCPRCDQPVGTQTADEMIDALMALDPGTKLYILAPIERRGQEKYTTLIEDIRRRGYSRLRIDGTTSSIDQLPPIDHRRKHVVEVVVDRSVVRDGNRSRIAEAVEQALELGQGVMSAALVDESREERQWRVLRFSRNLTCNTCSTSFEALTPHNYSFNSPLGWCSACEGLGTQRGANLRHLIRDNRRPLKDGTVAAWPSVGPANRWGMFVEALARHGGFSADQCFDELTHQQRRLLLQGSGETWLELPDLRSGSSMRRFQYKGIAAAIDEASRLSYAYRARLQSIADEVPCVVCGGSRLRPDAAASRFAGHTIGELCGMALDQLLIFLEQLELGPRDREIAGEVLREITNRVRFLVDVGLGYLTLDRPGPSLSGGEAQRIRLASQIGSGLTGVLYVLDEPTIGLHPRDNQRLLQALQRLRDLGNTLVLVEHDREVIASADYLLDFGPGAGDRGGEITARGTPHVVQQSEHSLTGQYLSGRRALPVPANRRIVLKSAEENPTPRVDSPSVPPGDFSYEFPNMGRLEIRGARQHNLQNIDVQIPLSALVAVTGVSGSGKSSLVQDVLYNTLVRRLHRAATRSAPHDEISGLDQIDKVIRVDQDPIGNSPSSNPATYTGLFDLIRELFAKLPESRLRGYHARRFSFNQKGGRCDACEGLGQKKIEMHFLPDVWVECDVCQGKRYNPETLAVRYRGKSIADVLNLRVQECMTLFEGVPKIRSILQTLVDVGLDYLSLGQPAPTLSGGESQRVKLAAELARPSTGRTLYILDEPTTGLHFDDVRKLLEVLHRLVDLGNTVLVVEHNLDIIKSADWIIDLGPEAGPAGGRIVATGTPEVLVRHFHDCSHTARALKPVLEADPMETRQRYNPRQEAATKLAKTLPGDMPEVRMPWETDGKTWHTQTRMTTDGLPCMWDGAALEIIERLVHRSGKFADTNWNHRSIVEIAAPQKTQGWFLHAHTGHPAYVKLVFRVKKNCFKLAELERQLELKPLSDYPGLEGYSRDHRVQVVNERGPWQTVVITLVRRDEALKPALAEFITQAAASFHEQLARMNQSIADLMPWKLNGQRWHLSKQGFPPGKGVRWDHGLLSDFLDLVRSIVPGLVIEWDNQHHISLKLPGISRSWARCRTKEAEAFLCSFFGQPGQFNRASVEAFAEEVEINADRGPNGDAIKFGFRSRREIANPRFRDWLRQHAEGCRAFFSR